MVNFIGDIKNGATGFFANLLAYEGIDQRQMEELLDFIPNLILPEQNADLLKSIDLEEVKGAFYQLDKDSAQRNKLCINQAADENFRSNRVKQHKAIKGQPLIAMG
ncbi:hypothetical protein ACH5RR_039166 [Cinchona calisaya]|uniref:Uncharacterized protein n=1 Tax=Cinchona calisaya TaxID=153742 RepID=A0ABD2Y319_9GENT